MTYRLHYRWLCQRLEFQNVLVYIKNVPQRTKGKTTQLARRDRDTLLDILCACETVTLMSVPYLAFGRGSSVGVCVCVFAFACMTRRCAYAFMLGLFCVCVHAPKGLCTASSSTFVERLRFRFDAHKRRCLSPRMVLLKCDRAEGFCSRVDRVTKRKTRAWDAYSASL